MRFARSSWLSTVAESASRANAMAFRSLPTSIPLKAFPPFADAEPSSGCVPSSDGFPESSEPLVGVSEMPASSCVESSVSLPSL